MHPGLQTRPPSSSAALRPQPAPLSVLTFICVRGHLARQLLECLQWPVKTHPLNNCASKESGLPKKQWRRRRPRSAHSWPVFCLRELRPRPHRSSSCPASRSPSTRLGPRAGHFVYYSVYSSSPLTRTQAKGGRRFLHTRPLGSRPHSPESSQGPGLGSGSSVLARPRHVRSLRPWANRSPSPSLTLITREVAALMVPTTWGRREDFRAESVLNTVARLPVWAKCYLSHGFLSYVFILRLLR